MKKAENFKTYMKTRSWLSFSFLLLLMTVSLVSFGQINTQVEKAFYLIDVEQPKAGMTLLEETVKANPTDASALYYLGIAQLKAGKKAEALATFDKGAALNEK